MAKKKDKRRAPAANPVRDALLQKAGEWLDVDMAEHAVKVAKRQAIEVKINLIVSELKVAEAELRLAEAEIAEHARLVEFEKRRRET